MSVTVEQVPMWAEDWHHIGHAVVWVNDGYTFTACCSLGSFGEATPERPKRICRKCRKALRTLSLQPTGQEVPT